LNATSSVSSSSKCTKIVGFAPDPTEEPTALPQTFVAGLMGFISKMGRGGNGKVTKEGREG